jgi:hypothetical protein
MATQTDLFLAILALDAYNRGYNPGMLLPDGSTTQIGDATILDTSADQSVSFYAVAYSWLGETIISYRGTTFASGPDFGDVLNGWTLSAGYAQASQAQMALAFYSKVQAETPGGGLGIQLTGHSLGGGLAGFVSDLTGAPADVFNNIPFGSGVAAESVLSSLPQGMSVPSSSANVRQFVTLGEVATGLRALTGPLSYATFLADGVDVVPAAALAAYGIVLDNTTSSSSQTLYSNVGIGNASPTNLHSQSLSVLLLYADVNHDTGWASVGKSLYDALFDDSIANKLLPFVATSGGWYTPSAKMMAAIAYSALYNPNVIGSSLVFGDTAIRALFDDEDQIGKLVTTPSVAAYLQDTHVQTALSDIAVEYAGLLAANRVTHDSDTTANTCVYRKPYPGLSNDRIG